MLPIVRGRLIARRCGGARRSERSTVPWYGFQVPICTAPAGIQHGRPQPACTTPWAPLEFSCAVSSLVRLLAFVLAFALFPGATEIVENATHLVASGHTAHAVDDSDHAPQGDEHGCSGTIHVCSCHTSVSFLLNNDRFALAAPLILSSSLDADARGEPASGHALGVYRPPSA